MVFSGEQLFFYLGNSTDDENVTDCKAAHMTAAHVLGATTALLSMVGALLIILPTLCWRDLKTTSRLILAWISVADFITATGNFVGIVAHFQPYTVAFNETTNMMIDPTPTDCVVQSFITTASSTASFLWTMAMAIYLYSAIVRQSCERMARLMPILHILCWGLPLAMASVGVSQGVLGRDKSTASAGWCFVRGADAGFSHYEQFLWQLFMGKLWEVTTYVVMIVLYMRVKCYLRRERYEQKDFVTTSLKQAASDVDRKLTFVPLAFILLRIWGTVRFFLSYHSSESCFETHDKFLFLLQSIGDSGQGIANCILFVLCTKKIRRRLARTFCWLCIKSHSRSSSALDRKVNFGPKYQAVAVHATHQAQPYTCEKRKAILSVGGGPLLPNPVQTPQESTPLIQEQ